MRFLCFMLKFDIDLAASGTRALAGAFEGVQPP
jgi:hypothetical protein